MRLQGTPCPTPGDSSAIFANVAGSKQPVTCLPSLRHALTPAEALAILRRRQQREETMARTIRIVRNFPVPPARVWTALTDSAELGKWLMPNDFVPELGHAFRFQMPPQRGWDGQTFCQVTELQPQTALAYTWQGRATGEKPLRCAGMDSAQLADALKDVHFELNSTIRYALTPTPTGTRLLLEHSGFTGKMLFVSLILELGWRTRVLARLAKLLAAG